MHRNVSLWILVYSRVLCVCQCGCVCFSIKCDVNNTWYGFISLNTMFNNAQYSTLSACNKLNMSWVGILMRCTAELHCSNELLRCYLCEICGFFQYVHRQISCSKQAKPHRRLRPKPNLLTGCRWKTHSLTYTWSHIFFFIFLKKQMQSLFFLLHKSKSFLKIGCILSN